MGKEADNLLCAIIYALSFFSIFSTGEANRNCDALRWRRFQAWRECLHRTSKIFDHFDLVHSASLKDGAQPKTPISIS